MFAWVRVSDDGSMKVRPRSDNAGKQMMVFAMRLKPTSLINCALAVVLLNGCTLQQDGAGHRGVAANRPPRSQSQPGSSRDYGPAYTSFEEGGLKWVRG